MSTYPCTSRQLLRIGVMLNLAPSLLFAQALQQRQPIYHVVHRFSIDSVKADYLTIDPVNRRLYGVGHTVIDIDRYQVVDTLPNPAYALAIAPDLQRGVTRQGDLIDLRTMHLTQDPVLFKTEDGAAYDPRTHRAVIVGDTTWVIDVRSGALVSKFTLPGTPQVAVADSKGHIFVTLSRANAIQVIDPVGPKPLMRWPIDPCVGPAGLAIDRSHDRLFASCSNNVMMVIDADNGRVVAKVPVGSGADADAFDANKRLILNPNNDGTLTVIHEDSPDTYRVIGTDSVGQIRNTLALDEKTHRVFTYQRVGTGLLISVLAH
jgi:hypothetical protein